MRAGGIRPAFLAMLIAVALVGCSSEEVLNPSPTAFVPSATSVPIGTAIPAVETPEGSDVTIDELLGSIERGIENIRGIDTPSPVEHNFVDQSGMQKRLAEELADPEIVEQLTHESALLKLLGVIPQESDLTGIYESMLGSQVLGLYDPEKEQFFVLGNDQSGADFVDTEAQLTYAHEYVHRLQDAEFDLEAIEDLATGDDMSIAISALIEGDATTAQTQYMLKNYSFTELAQLFESTLAAQGDIPEAPYFLQRSLEFPYTEGAAFVAILIQMGGFAAVDAVFNDLPRSTEQVLHPEKYLDKEEPTTLDIPDDAMGAEWSVQNEDVLGEFFLRTWLEALGPYGAATAAAGWAGDAYAVFENSSDDFAVVILIAWDDDSDASEFFEIAAEVLDANEDFVSSGIGISGVLRSWEGSGGFVTVGRQETALNGEVITIAVAPGAGDSVSLATTITGTGIGG